MIHLVSSASDNGAAIRQSNSQTDMLRNDMQSVIFEFGRTMQESDTSDKVAAVLRLPDLFDTYPFPTLINTLFHRLGELFIADSSTNTIRWAVLSALTNSEHHLTKLSSVGIIVEKFFHVTFSTDELARAIALRCLAVLASVIPDEKIGLVHHRLLDVLDKPASMELSACLATTSLLLPHSVSFSQRVLAKFSEQLFALTTDSSIRCKLVRSLAYLAPDIALANKARHMVCQLLEKFPSERLVLTSLRTLTQLTMRQQVNVSAQIFLVLSVVEARPALTSRLFVILSPLTRFAHCWEPGHVQALLHRLDGATAPIVLRLLARLTVAPCHAQIEAIILQSLDRVPPDGSTAALLGAVMLNLHSTAAAAGNIGCLDGGASRILSAFLHLKGENAVVFLTALRSALRLENPDKRLLSALVTAATRPSPVRTVALRALAAALSHHNTGLSDGEQGEIAALVGKVDAETEYAALNVLLSGSRRLCPLPQSPLTTAPWLRYRLACNAATAGHFPLAVELFSALRTLSQDQKCRRWLGSLRDISTAEAALLLLNNDVSSANLMATLQAASRSLLRVIPQLTIVNYPHVAVFQQTWIRQRAFSLVLLSSLASSVTQARLAASTPARDMENAVYFSDCIERLRHETDSWSSLRSQLFDADIASLQHCEVAAALSRSLAELLTNWNVEGAVLTNYIPDCAPPTLAADWRIALTKTNSSDVSTPDSQRLLRTCVAVTRGLAPLPLYFTRHTQQTVLKLEMTPSRDVTLMTNSQLVVKLEGVVEQRRLGDGPLRRRVEAVNAVLSVSLVSSEDGLTKFEPLELRRREKLSSGFFTMDSLVPLRAPGSYSASLVLEFECDKGERWSPHGEEKIELNVKAVSQLGGGFSGGKQKQKQAGVGKAYS